MTYILTIISIPLIRITTPIIIAFGIIGNLLNIAVLTRSVLLKHTCSYYFLALAFTNLFVSSFIITTDYLAVGYQIDLSTTSLISCKFIRYASNTSALLSTNFLVLASIDRYCASSSNANRRKFSSLKFARWAIIFVLCFFGLLHINSLILFDLEKTQTKLQCSISTDTLYKQIYTITEFSIFALIAPCLMTIFGLMTIYNTKQLRVLPIETSRYRRTESQLVIMLLFQVGTYILLNIPICIIYVLNLLPYIFIDTSELNFISIIFRLLNYLSYTTNFFLYVFSSRLYREELIRLMKKIRRGLIHNQIQPNVLNNRN